ncbi:MAG: transglutaminase domain-containing protein [Culturomica sp.]|jgi:hypothetical protein|nr:transglutaminase domain-containing protein [Culturomica sp.]
MKKFLKWTAIGIGGIVVLLFALVLIRVILIKFQKEAKTKYVLEALKTSPAYSTVPVTPFPVFQYQDSSAVDLVDLRRTYHLDSIAGSGDEISRIKNLMFWVHNNVSWDGSHFPPCAKNAKALIAYYQNEQRGVNCRMMSMILSEIYLACGFKSRFITCMPKDSTDNDCHVISIVWSETLEKWIWMDASFGAFVSDENGTLLSIEEVRERIIEEKKVALNPEASVREEYYLGYYMPKNLYWFSCSDVSAFGVEDRDASGNRMAHENVALCPEGFPAWNPYGMKFTTTHQAEQFWIRP